MWYERRGHANNTIMRIQRIKETRKADIEESVCVDLSCVYPGACTVPPHEGGLQNGYPEEMNALYGLVKRMLLVELHVYQQKDGFNDIHLAPVNLHGPGVSFDGGTSHVNSAPVGKGINPRRYGRDSKTVWGMRDVTVGALHVEDAAHSRPIAAGPYDDSRLVNLWLGKEILPRDLTDLVEDLTEFEGKVGWDESRSDAQSRRMLGTALPRDSCRFESKVGFAKETIERYRGPRNG